jgi:hypothetical protein
MSQYEMLTPEQRGLLVGLIYRVGIWISHSDDEDGENDDKREMKALSQIIHSLAHAEEASEFLRTIAKNTLSRKEKWPLWADHSFDILADAENAMEVLRANVAKEEAAEYRAALLRISEAVASAHGEFGFDMSGEEEGFGALIGKMIGKIKGDNDDEIDIGNISAAENDAIERLKMATRPRDK